MRSTDVPLVVLLVAVALWTAHWSTFATGGPPAVEGVWPGELAALLVSQSLWPLLPVWALGHALARRGRHLGAAVAIWLGCGLLWLVVGTNLRFLRMTGNGVLFHLGFLGDEGAVALAGGRFFYGVLGVSLVTLAVPFALFPLLLLVLRRAGRSLGAGSLQAAATAALLMAAPLPVVGAESVPAVLLARSLLVPIPSARLLAAEPTTTLLGHVDAGLVARSAEIAELLDRERRAELGIRWPEPPRASVLFIVVESLRHDALTPETMPRSFAWGEARGIRGERHFAETNTSHRGTFALLYGRSPLAYERTIAAREPSPLLASLRAAGYHCSFFAGASVRWRGMDVFLSSLNFDEITIDTEGESVAERDARNVTRALARLRAGERSCVVLHLDSTHFPYDYPPAAERHHPAATLSPSQVLRTVKYGAMQRVRGPHGGFRDSWWNRYRNAAGNLDERIEPLLHAVADAVVVLTGDHGESFHEDGSWLHSSRLSDVQTLVPLRVSGGRLPRMTVHGPSRHVDVVPTVLRALGAELTAPDEWTGRDLASPAGDAEPDVLLVDPDGEDLALLGGEERLHLIRRPGGGLRAAQFEDGRAMWREMGPGSEGAAASRVDAVVAALEKRTR